MKIFFAVFWTQLTNVLVDARANIKQQTWTVRPFQELTLNKLWKFGRRIVKTLCTYFQFNCIKCIIYLYNLYNITFRLTNVIPERIIFVSRGITVQFWPPDNDHMCSKHVEAWNKLIIKFSASSWLILRNKYVEMHGQQKKKGTHLSAAHITDTPANRQKQNVPIFQLLYHFLARTSPLHRLPAESSYIWYRHLTDNDIWRLGLTDCTAEAAVRDDKTWVSAAASSYSLHPSQASQTSPNW